MGEDKVNVSSGLVLEQGQVRWQTCVSQSAPPRHEFIDWYNAQQFDQARMAARTGGEQALIALMDAVQLPVWQGWQQAETAAAVLSLIVAPHSSAWG